jgi:hypothetical protein
MHVRAKALLVSFTKFDKTIFWDIKQQVKCTPIIFNRQYRPSCAALYKSTKSSIATEHFLFLDPPLQSQSNVYACETESNILKKRIF